MFKKRESFERKEVRNKNDNNMKIKGLARFVFIKTKFYQSEKLSKVLFQFFEYPLFAS